MNVCFLTHNVNRDNGAGVFSRRIIEGLREKLGAEASVFSVLPSEDLFALPILSEGRLSVFRNIFRLHRRFRSVDLIHAFDVFPYGVLAVLASLGLSKPVIVTANGSGSILPLHSLWQAPLARFALRRATLVTAISRFTRNEIVKRVSGLSIKVFTPGVDFSFWHTPGRPIPPPDLPTRFILGVGSLRWRKGYHRSIVAFSRIAREVPDLHYVIVGKRYTDLYWNRIQNLVRELGLADRVHILDAVDDPEALRYTYQRAELFFLMSQNRGHDVEGFGLVFLEAAAAGLPVVGSRGCGVEDAILEGKNGFLVDERNEAEAAEALRKILTSDELRKRFSEESIRFAEANDWAGKIDEYAAIYREFLKDGKM